jgi:hypothetical protein
VKPPKAHLKRFGLPQTFNLVMVDKKEKIVVPSLEAQTLEVSLFPKTPWLIKTNCTQFPIGYAQRTIIGNAAKAYRRPKLATIGRFFYRVNKKRQHMRSQHFAILVICKICNPSSKFSCIEDVLLLTHKDTMKLDNDLYFLIGVGCP